MQVSLPSKASLLPPSNNFLMSPLLVLSLLLSVLLPSDLFARSVLCPSLEKHIHMTFIAAFSYGTSNSQLSTTACTQGGTDRDIQHL